MSESLEKEHCRDPGQLKPWHKVVGAEMLLVYLCFGGLLTLRLQTNPSVNRFIIANNAAFMGTWGEKQPVAAGVMSLLNSLFLLKCQQYYHLEGPLQTP